MTPRAAFEGDVKAELPRLAVGRDLVVLSDVLSRPEDADDLDVGFAPPVEGPLRATPRPYLLADREPLAADGGLLLVA